MRLKTGLLLLLALALWLGGCAKAPVTAPGPSLLPPRPTAEDDAARLLRLGQDSLNQGKAFEAGEAFRALLAKQPGFDLAAAARLGLARAEAAQGRREEALRILGELNAKGAPGPVRVEGELLTARLEKDGGDLAGATKRLRGLLVGPPAPLNAEQRRQAVQQLAELLEAQEQYAPAAANLVALAADSPAFELAAISRHLAEVAGKAPSLEVERLLVTAAQPQVRAALLLGLARAQVREGRVDEAENTLKEFKRLPESQPLLPLLQGFEREREAVEAVEPRAVGVILPLSGNLAAHGRRVLAAIELGLGLFSDGDRALTLYIEDSEGDPRRTAEAVNRLAKERKVIAILGPLEAATSLAAARAAQENKLPLVCLSPQEGVTQAGDYVFQNFFTPSDQVEALLGEVMDRRGYRRLALMAPRTPYGQGFAKLFDAGVMARGGLVVRSLWYQPNQTDFTNDVKQLVHLPPGTYRTGRPDSPKPVIDFDALFVPDSVERAALVVPQLLYHDVAGVNLLGTNLWHNPKFLGLAGRYLTHSVIPDAFDPASPEPLVATFTREFREALGQEPSVIDAHGYDSALILHRLLQQPEPPRTRSALRLVLSEMRDIPGVTGQMTMGPDRRVRKPLMLFTVQGEAFKRLLPENPPPANPEGLPGAAGGIEPSSIPAGGMSGAAAPYPAVTPNPENLPVAPAATIAR